MKRKVREFLTMHNFENNQYFSKYRATNSNKPNQARNNHPNKKKLKRFNIRLPESGKRPH